MRSTQAGPVVSAALMKKVCWRLVPLMVLMYLANSLDRANIGYAALTMNKDLGITTAEFGIAASLLYLGYIACQIPSNLILHRIGARLWIATILLCWGAVSSLTSLVPNTGWLYIARFMLGVFEAGLFPGMILYLTLWLPSRNRVWLMSMFVTAMPLSAVIGAPISTSIMSQTSVFGLSGWRTMLLLEGLPAVLLGIFVYFYLPAAPRQSKWLNDSELAELEEAIALEKGEEPGQHSEAGVMSAVKNGRVWALGVVYYGINAGILVLLFFLPQVIKTFEASFGVKYSVVDVGMITVVPFGFAVVCMLLWARYLSRRGVAAAYRSSSRHWGVGDRLRTPDAVAGSRYGGVRSCSGSMFFVDGTILAASEPILKRQSSRSGYRIDLDARNCIWIHACLCDRLDQR